MKVTIWNEFRHEKRNEKVKEIYPNGIHEAIAEPLRQHFDVTTATLDEPEHGLTDSVLDSTDVLLWWGHIAHDEVDDRVVTRTMEAVRRGMGLIVLHSAHYSKIFRRLMGTTCSLKWREAGETERMWSVAPGHPITEELDDPIIIPRAEMYGEFFDIPTPETLVFISSFDGGEVFRSGCCYTRGYGRIFYFRPGHETYPIYYQAEVQKVIRNAICWAGSTQRRSQDLTNVQTPMAK